MKIAIPESFNACNLLNFKMYQLFGIATEVRLVAIQMQLSCNPARRR